jgi:hypothetical protein
VCRARKSNLVARKGSDRKKLIFPTRMSVDAFAATLTLILYTLCGLSFLLSPIRRKLEVKSSSVLKSSEHPTQHTKGKPPSRRMDDADLQYNNRTGFLCFGSLACKRASWSLGNIKVRGLWYFVYSTSWCRGFVCSLAVSL